MANPHPGEPLGSWPCQGIEPGRSGMGFQEKYATAASKLFNSGDDALFNTLEGTAIPCKIFIEKNVMLQPAGLDSQVYEKGITIEALLSVIGREPLQTETFTYPAIDGDVYEVRTIIENDGVVITSQVVEL